MLKAADVMTADVISVTPETLIHDVAKLMCTKHISGVPVLDREGRIIGTVSEGDLIRHAGIAGEQRRPWWRATFASTTALAHDYVKTHGHIAGDVMTAPAITVAPTASLSECAKIMNEHRIKRVLVVEDGKLVGIVTRGDLLQALAADDVATPANVDDRAIRERLFAEVEPQRWAHLLNKDIVVQNGVVDIRGVVETEDERRAWRVAMESVPGVKRIEDHTRTRPLFRLG